MSLAPARIAPRSGRFFLGIALLGSTFAGAARAQEILEKAYGAASGDYFGWSVAMGPDLDGDGYREVAVGSPFASSTAIDAGVVDILSGRDYLRLQTLRGAIAWQEFGESVCWCGDVDGDGLDDLAVGAPETRTSAIPSVFIYSSATWNQLRVLQSTSPTYDEFGKSLANAGDVNGDGVDDLLVGAPKGSVNGADSGSLLLHSGADGSLLWSIDGVAHSDLGASAAAVGDLNGDGYVDFAVGEPWHDGAYPNDYGGVVEVYSGKDRTVLQSWSGTSYWIYYSSYFPSLAGDRLGIAVGAAGDFDADGVPDVWAASLAGWQNGGAYVKVFSGATGKTLRTMTSRDYSYNLAAAAIGDSDGDGLPEFVAVGGYRNTPGHVFLFSSLDGRVLWETDDRSNVAEFMSVAGDPSSTTDFLLGLGGNGEFAPYAGKVELRASNDLWLDVSPTHFPSFTETLILTAAEGRSGSPAALFLTDLNGIPAFTLLSVAPFNATHSATLLSMMVPSGLSGTALTVRAFTIGPGSNLIDSIDELITVR
jgi:hypothetical protein